MEVEKVYDFDIPDEHAVTLETVGKLFDYVAVHSERAGSAEPGMYVGPEWEAFLDLVVRETGVRRAQLVPSARFTYDLGLD